MALRLARFKPGVQRTTHLQVAAVLWSCAGLLLLSRGVEWLRVADLVLLAVPAILLGFGKSRYILDRTARKGVERILALKDGTCLGAVYSKWTWLLVLAMMAMGIVLRNSDLPRTLLAVVYVTVGWALLFSSRVAWYAWWRHRQ
jgi:hypothetical protein